MSCEHCHMPTPEGQCDFCAPVELCEECGYPPESFACRIRHIQINTGAAKAAKDR